MQRVHRTPRRGANKTNRIDHQCASERLLGLDVVAVCEQYSPELHIPKSETISGRHIGWSARFACDNTTRQVIQLEGPGRGRERR